MSKLRVVAVGQPPFIAGFALAGVTTVEAETTADAATRLADLIARDDVGVVVVERAVINALPEAARRRLGRQSLPIMLTLPKPDWGEARAEGESQILDLLQRAIGYRVRLQ